MKLLQQKFCFQQVKGSECENTEKNDKHYYI